MAKRRNASKSTAGGRGEGRSKASGKVGSSKPPETASYKHPEATSLLRPEIGTQPQFRKKKPPATYRYDSSLSPALEWDGQNAARDLGAWLIRCIEEYAAELQGGTGFQSATGGQDARPTQKNKPDQKNRQDAGATKVFKNVRGEVVATVRSLADAVEQLKRLERPFLNWAGKVERLSFDVPCWLLDSDYNGLCFKASQVFFPRTAAWDDLKRALKAEYAESVWDHLAGTTSAPFQIGESGQAAVKVIDDRGNELLVTLNVDQVK